MVVIGKIGALKAYYYLMAVDGISETEKGWFDEIGEEYLKDGYKELGEMIIEECQDHLKDAEPGELQDVIMEEIDKALTDIITNPEYGTTPRHLIWNMLSLAYCDGYTDEENRIISHVARILEVDKSVFAELKQLMSTAVAVDKEYEELKQSDRPYNEIEPLVQEAEKRKEKIMNVALQLLEDEILLADSSKNKKKQKEEVLDNDTVEEPESTIKKSTKGIKSGAGKLLSGIASVAKKTNIILPEKYERINKKMPEDSGLPKSAVDYRMLNDSTYAYVLCFPVSEQESMDFDDVDGIINAVHDEMKENQVGLIEVKSGTTKKGGKYVYIIRKMNAHPEDENPFGMMYMLNLNFQSGDTIQFINATFEERGDTGYREAMVMALLQNQGEMGDGFDGWTQDPYDKDFRDGFLMNRSEEEQFDKMFMDHPLSEARRFVKFVVGMN